MADKRTNALAEPHAAKLPQETPAQTNARLEAQRAANQPAKDEKKKAEPRTPESKAAAFRKLANKRLPALIKRCKHVSALANRATYAYTDEQREKLIAVVRQGLKMVEEAFAGNTEVKAEELF